jgi:hypothetical protein
MKFSIAVYKYGNEICLVVVFSFYVTVYPEYLAMPEDDVTAG